MTAPFDDSPAPRHPQLEAMIRAARSQPTPQVNVRFEDVQAAASRRSTWRVAALAAAAGLVGVVAWAWPQLQSPSDQQLQQEMPSIAVADEVPALSPGATPTVPYAEATGRPRDTRGAKAEVLTLEGGATVERMDEGPAPTPTLERGRFRVVTADQPVTLPLGAQVLEIAAASEVFIDTTAPKISFEVHTGRAKWARDPDRGGSSARPGPGATDLAAQAEAAVLARDHAEAARLLRKLVRLHPSSAAAKAGLIDLARLEKTLGNHRRAHCAYASFLARFPSDARAPSVRTADEALGLSAVQCRGLNPGAN